MTATARKNEVVTGNARWLANGNILITPAGGEEQEYEPEETTNGYRLHCVTTLVRTGEFKFYTLERHPGGIFLCNCPDVTKGGRHPWACKHARGLRAALRKAF